MKSQGLVGMALAVCALCLALAAPVGAQEFDYMMPNGSGDFGGVKIEVYWSEDARPILGAKGHDELGALKKKWTDALKMGGTVIRWSGDGKQDFLDYIPKLRFAVNVQIKSGMHDITDFPSFAPDGKVTAKRPLRVRLKFNDARDVPSKIFVVSDKENTLLLGGWSGGKAAGPDYDLNLVRDPFHDNVLWLMVNKWPAGDPRICG